MALQSGSHLASDVSLCEKAEFLLPKVERGQVESLYTPSYVFSELSIMESTTQAALRQWEEDLFVSGPLQARLHNAEGQHDWERYKARLADHIIHCRRRLLAKDADRFTKRGDGGKTCRALHRLNHPPSTPLPALPPFTALTQDPPGGGVGVGGGKEGSVQRSASASPAVDGRWPFLYPSLSRTSNLKRLAGVSPITVMLTDCSLI